MSLAAPAPRRCLTAHARRIHRKKVAAVSVIRDRLAAGASLRESARAAGVTYPTGRRWLIQYLTDGEDGLRPRFQDSGRRSVLEALHLDLGALSDAQLCVMAAGSTDAGLRQFRGSKACPPELAQVLDSSTVPPSIRRAVHPLQLPATVRIGGGWFAVEFIVTTPKRPA